MNIWVTFNEIDDTKRLINDINETVFSSYDLLNDEVQKMIKQYDEDISKIENSIRTIDYDLSSIAYAISSNERMINEIDNEISNTSTGEDEEIQYLVNQKRPYLYNNQRLEELRDNLFRTRDRFSETSNKIKEQQISLNNCLKQYLNTIQSVRDNLNSLSNELDYANKIVKDIVDELDPYMDGVHINNALKFEEVGDMVKEEADKLARDRKELNKASLNLHNNLQDEVSRLASAYVDDISGNNSFIKTLDHVCDVLYRVGQLIRRYNEIGK